MIYLSPTSQIPNDTDYGIMFSANHSIGGQQEAIKSGVKWMMDNNNFTGDFTPVKWFDWLAKYRRFSGNCLGIPVPDKVGDCLETLRLFGSYHQIIRDNGYPVAFVSQDGLTPMLTPWDYFDTLFIGGSDDHKLGSEAALLIAEAKGRGKWVHVGRVNSESRIRQFWMVDSCDGSGLIRDAGQTRIERFKEYSRGIHYARNRKAGRIGASDQYAMAI